MDDVDGTRFDDLSAPEVRVLGCLIEKEATVPDTYPLTLNSLRSACNQSTSRDPVVSYGDHDIEQALTTLRARGLTRIVHSTSNRATKYRHVLPDVFELDPAETAVLSVLMLRGAQTVGELKTRSERQHRFDSTDEVAAVLAGLAARPAALAVELPRQPGQKDTRWVHLLSPVEHTAAAPPASGRRGAASEDPYGDATAEFYDLLASRIWDGFGLQLLDLLADADPTAGPIVDIGTGTGVGLPFLTAAVPGATIFAIEPSRAMRVALHARLHDDPALAVVTTVSPTRWRDAPAPSSACAVVVSAALGHLDDGERDALWRYIATALPAGAPAVVGVLPPARSILVPLLQYADRQVGDYRYQGWQSGDPIDERTMTRTLLYRVLAADGSRVAEYRSSTLWRCDGVDDVRAEIEPHGLTLVEHDGCVVVRRAS